MQSKFSRTVKYQKILNLSPIMIPTGNIKNNRFAV